MLQVIKAEEVRDGEPRIWIETPQPVMHTESRRDRGCQPCGFAIVDRPAPTPAADPLATVRAALDVASKATPGPWRTGTDRLRRHQGALTMPTDLRAALRDQLAAAFDAAWDATGEGFNGEYTRRSFTSEMYERMRAEHIDKILTDTPPTVAELLPMVDATHEVRWTSRSGTLCRCLLDDRGGIRAFAVERQGSSGRWLADLLRPSDLTQPARLVEVTP